MYAVGGALDQTLYSYCCGKAGRPWVRTFSLLRSTGWRVLCGFRSQLAQQQSSSMASKGVSLGSRLAEKFFYDFSMYKMYFKDKMPYQKYVAL